MIRHGATGIGLIALGAGVAASAVLGPLVLNVVKLRTSEAIGRQFMGGELVSLTLVAPVSIAAGILWLRRHRLAPALALAPALYAVYTYTTVVVGEEYALYPGNVEQFFLLYAGLVAGGAAIAVSAWSRLRDAEVPVPSPGLRRTLAATFIGLGGFFALAWTAQIRLVLTGNPPIEYQEGPTLFWLIKLLDVGFVIPALLTAGVGLLQQRPAAIRVAYGLAGFATCLAASIAGMGIIMLFTGDPSAEPVMVAVLIPATAGLAALTWSPARANQLPHQPRRLRRWHGVHLLAQRAATGFEDACRLGWVPTGGKGTHQQPVIRLPQGVERDQCFRLPLGEVGAAACQFRLDRPLLGVELNFGQYPALSLDPRCILARQEPPPGDLQRHPRLGQRRRRLPLKHQPVGLVDGRPRPFDIDEGVARQPQLVPSRLTPDREAVIRCRQRRKNPAQPADAAAERHVPGIGNLIAPQGVGQGVAPDRPHPVEHEIGPEPPALAPRQRSLEDDRLALGDRQATAEIDPEGIVGHRVPFTPIEWRGRCNSIARVLQS